MRQIIIIANGINSQTPKLQRALAWVLDELERNQKKEDWHHVRSRLRKSFYLGQIDASSGRSFFFFWKYQRFDLLNSMLFYSFESSLVTQNM